MPTPAVPTAQRLPAERRFAEELALLAAEDSQPRPPGWQLSPQAVRRFILGDGGRISAKYVGEPGLVERCIVTLMGQRGLLLVGEPGTAKSMLSELLAAAISGDSTLTVQGSSGTTEDHVRHGWNYALLIGEGPGRRALVPSPVLRAMESGRLVRFEEITRCPAEVQDVLISLMSERLMQIAELGDDGTVLARPGFNIVATANLRDRGTHELSGALKRRFAFETVPPIADFAAELALVAREVSRLAAADAVPAAALLDLEALEVLVTAMRELRSGLSRQGAALERPTAVLSAAEGVAVGHAALLDAVHFGNGRLGGAEVARHLVGAVLQDDPSNAGPLRKYLMAVARPRADEGSIHWRGFAAAAQARLTERDAA